MTTSPFTVEQLLQLPVFRQAKVLAGSGGLTNEIYYVDAMEIPDLTGWLRPNELIVTTGYSVRHEPFLLCRLLDEMHRVGGAAVAIKTKRFLQDVPADALRKSDAYRIPLIDIPAEIPSIDLTHSVMEVLVNRQAAVLREVQEVNQQFTNLVLNRRTTELVVLIGQLLHCEAAVLDQEGNVESSTSRFSEREIAEKRSVQVGSRVLGYLAISRRLEEQDRFAHMCLEQAVTILAIEFTIRQSLQLQREREQESFLVDLLSGTSGEEELLRYRAKQLGIPHGARQYVMVIRPCREEERQGETMDDLLHDLLKDIQAGEKTTRRGVLVGGEIAVLCTTAHRDVARQREEAVDYLRALTQSGKRSADRKRLVCGVGGVRERLEEITESYREAQKALRIGSLVRPRERIVHFHDVLVEDLLQDATGHPSLAVLTQTLIEPLAAYDREYGTELLPTLESFLRTGGQTKRVGEELYIHRNSVLYRLERIRDILGVDLNDAETRLRLDLAMRAWKMAARA
jgi:PucR family transcriptional regulator, purine catabolism regulatory protein